MREERRHNIFALAILGLVPSLLFLDVLLGINGFYMRDIAHYYFPAKKILREIVLGGQFPYWNPWFSAGQPLAANPEHEVFYPLNWLILLPDYVQAFQLLALLHIFIATFAMYALLRSMDLGRPASCFGALSFGVGGIVCSLLNLFPCLFSIAWLPLTCLFARRFLQHHRMRDLAGASFFLGLQLLVGEPVTALLSGLLLGGYAIYRGSLDKGWRGIPKRVSAIALISIVALLVAAVQVVPAFDHVRDTVRSKGISYEMLSTWSTPPIRFFESVYPHVLGRFNHEGSPAYWGSALYGTKRTGFFFSIYCGLAVAVFAMAGVVARTRGWPLFLIIVIVSGIAAAGHYTPLLRMLYETGIAISVRFPEKFLMMGVFASIVFSCHVLDGLLRQDERTRKAALAVAIGVTTFAFAAAAGAMTSSYAWLFRTLFHVDPQRAIERSLALARGDWLMAASRGLALLFLLLLLRHFGPTRRPVWLALFGLFVLLDLAAQVPAVAPRISQTFYREAPETARRFPPNRNEYRIFHMAEWTTDTPRARAFSRPSADYYWILRNGLSPHLAAAYGLRTAIEGDYDETSLRAERDFTASVWELAAKGPRTWIDIVTSMSNVWYLGVYQRPDDAIRAAGGWNRRLEPVKFLEGRHHPRYYFASELVSIRDREDFVRHLREHRYSREVGFIHEPAFQPARGIVRSWREWTNGARLEVDATGRAFLIMSVTPHRYWRVTVDGAETRSLVTNIGYQGVVVPPGRHVVEMRYRNPLVAAGGAVSAATLLALILLMWRRPLAG